jgi:hypothetical protein
MIGRINDDPSKLIHWQPCGKDFTYWACIKRPQVLSHPTHSRTSPTPQLNHHHSHPASAAPPTLLPSPPTQEGKPFEVRGGDPPAMKKWLLQHYADFPEILPLIEATDPKEILERPVLDRAPIKRWAFGRTMLIGDAVGGVGVCLCSCGLYHDMH